MHRGTKSGTQLFNKRSKESHSLTEAGELCPQTTASAFISIMTLTCILSRSSFRSSWRLKYFVTFFGGSSRLLCICIWRRHFTYLFIAEIRTLVANIKQQSRKASSLQGKDTCHNKAEHLKPFFLFLFSSFSFRLFLHDFNSDALSHI